MKIETFFSIIVSVAFFLIGSPFLEAYPVSQSSNSETTESIATASPSANETQSDLLVNSDKAPLSSLDKEALSFDVELAFVGDPCNAGDKRGYGAISYNYQITKYDVTARQYCAFLNAVAADDPYHLYDERMASDPAVASIERSDSAPNYTYSIIDDPELDRGTLPITYVDCYSAMRFCNWLEQGQPIGEEGPETTETGAYSLNGSDTLVAANKNATWRLPTENEWYKAAYYKGGSAHAGYWKYPMQTDGPLPFDAKGTPLLASYFSQQDESTPFLKFDLSGAEPVSITGSPPIKGICLSAVDSFDEALGAYETYGMGGNVFEWTSSTESLFSNAHHQGVVIRGGCWKLPSPYLLSDYSRLVFDPADRLNYVGFRVVAPILITSAASEEKKQAASKTVKPSYQIEKQASPIKVHHLASKEVLAVVAIIAILILAGWWLWPGMIEIGSASTVADISDAGVEMIPTRRIKSEVAFNMEDFFESPEQGERYDGYNVREYDDTPWRKKITRKLFRRNSL